MRRLIVNADDFGLTPGVNRGILEAHARGLVTSTTLMANAGASVAALDLAADHRKLSVGCHVVLVDGIPVLAGSLIPSLVDGSSGGRSSFCRKLSTFASRSVTHRLDPDHVEAEAGAQFRAVLETGIEITHFDTHKHTHMFPAVLRPLLRAAKACGIGALRNPFGPRLHLGRRELRGNAALLKRSLQLLLLRSFAPSFRRSVQQSGLRTPDGSVGVLSTGSLDLQIFESIMDGLPSGTWEFVCHPGYYDDPLKSVGTRLRQSREQELEVLTSARAREALDRRGIQLISYREL